MEVGTGTGGRVAATARAGVGDDAVPGVPGSAGGPHHRGDLRAGHGVPQAGRRERTLHHRCQRACRTLKSADPHAASRQPTFDPLVPGRGDHGDRAGRSATDMPMQDPQGADAGSAARRGGGPGRGAECIGSRLRPAGSGRTSVRAKPATATPAVSSSVPRSPSEVWSTGNRKTPMNAPSLPMPAEIPCPVARMLTGYSSLGMTKVVMFGPHSVKKSLT